MSVKAKISKFPLCGNWPGAGGQGPGHVSPGKGFLGAELTLRAQVGAHQKVSLSRPLSVR